MSSAQLNTALVLTSFHPGGTEYQTIELMQRLDPSRWRIHVACLHREGAWRDRAERAATTLREFPITSFTRPGTLGQMRQFARWCREQQILLVHAADFYANVFALPAAAWARVPVRIGSRRELNPDKTSAQIALQRAAYACAHCVVANSHAAAERLQQERVAPSRIAVVPNGLDLTRFVTPRTRRPGMTIMVVANLRKEKGHRTLLHAATTVLSRHPAARFQFVGDGPERAGLEQLAHELGVAGAVDFLGHRENVGALLASADLSVVPSTSEAFPNAALEAMASGLPVVASSVGGLLELVRPGHNGLLIPHSDSAALAQAIITLLDDTRLRLRMGAAARQDVFSRYSFDRMVASIDSLYLTELHRRRAVPPAAPTVTVS